MMESRLLVAKPFAFLLNQSRLQLLYFSRSGELLFIQKLSFLVLLLAKLLLCLLLSRLLARRLKVLFAKSMVVSAKKGSSLIERLLLYFHFESFDKYYQGIDVLNQSMKLIFFLNSIKKK